LAATGVTEFDSVALGLLDRKETISEAIEMLILTNHVPAGTGERLGRRWNTIIREDAAEPPGRLTSYPKILTHPGELLVRLRRHPSLAAEADAFERAILEDAPYAMIRGIVAFRMKDAADPTYSRLLELERSKVVTEVNHIPDPGIRRALIELLKLDESDFETIDGFLRLSQHSD
jgi:hypothetical protein